MRLSSDFGKRRGVTGGGNGAATPPASPHLRQNPPLWIAAILYSAHGPNYAPAFPVRAVVGAAYGRAYNCLVHSLLQMLSGDRADAPDSSAGARCASVRGARVAKYGFGTNSELELQVWWRLIVEELGGDSGDWDVLF